MAVEQLVDLKKTLEELEVGWLRKAMREHRGNQTRAAQALGITRDNLRYRIKQYGKEYLMRDETPAQETSVGGS